MNRILLCSVFGPYGQDDEYGSRRLNPMELYHNQVTRTQGAFSLRMFHRSWGLMIIQANIDAPCILLDFPSLDRFVQEIRTHKYEVVGISSIVPNLFKVKKMCELTRHYLPQAKIVVGGHVANIPDLKEQIDVDCIVKGEGIQWFREFLGQDPKDPINHPLIVSGFRTRNFGINPKERQGAVAATVIPSVGCPLGCNFCSTSAMFGGKGKSVNFYNTGEELFYIMLQLEREMGVRSFFIMDENFLLHKKRALKLLELMENFSKPWSLYVFSSANMIRSYTTDELIRMGISWVWMGIEGENSQYQKLSGINTFELVHELQSNGIHVLGSTIIGLENHTPENIGEAINYAARHNTDFHQFMLYTPIPGTKLYEEIEEKGQMKKKEEYDIPDIHGQSILNYHHPFLTDEDTAKAMISAFNRDFELNGPSTVRIVRTALEGWLRHKNHPDLRVRERYAWEARELAAKFSAVVGAAKLYYRGEKRMYKKMSDLLGQLHAEFGWKSRLFSAIGGRWVFRKVQKEERRLAEGFCYEPQTFYERNSWVLDRPEAALCRFAVPLAIQKKM